MAKIIPFPQVNNQTWQMVDDIIDVRMKHKHPAVLECLKKEMKGLVAKYFSKNEVSASLILPADLTEEQFKLIEQNVQKVIQEQNNRAAKRANELFLDLCLSRMTICELRHQLQDND